MIWGLVALVAVALVVGAVLGGAALFGSRSLGLKDGGSAIATGASDATLYIPSPSPTKRSAGALVTLAPGQSSAAVATSPAAGKPAKRITLIAGEKQVASFGNIDLSGSYPQGEGAVLDVQRLENGRWTSFYSVTAVVAGGSYSTVVQTSRSGVNVFRVIDSDTKLTSNPVRVRVG